MNRDTEKQTWSQSISSLDDLVEKRIPGSTTLMSDGALQTPAYRAEHGHRESYGEKHFTTLQVAASGRFNYPSQHLTQTETDGDKTQKYNP